VTENLVRIACILAATLVLSACQLSPTQQKWAGVAAGVLIVGGIAAYKADHGDDPDSVAGTVVGKPGMPCTPQPDGTCR